MEHRGLHRAEMYLTPPRVATRAFFASTHDAAPEPVGQARGHRTHVARQPMRELSREPLRRGATLGEVLPLELGPGAKVARSGSTAGVQKRRVNDDAPTSRL